MGNSLSVSFNTFRIVVSKFLVGHPQCGYISCIFLFLINASFYIYIYLYHLATSITDIFAISKLITKALQLGNIKIGKKIYIHPKHVDERPGRTCKCRFDSIFSKRVPFWLNRRRIMSLNQTSLVWIKAEIAICIV